MIAYYAALLACLLLAALAVFQTALVFGAPLGAMAWGGQHVVLPRSLRIGSAASILIYAIFALVLLERVGVVDVLGREVAEFGAWAIAAYGGLGTALNAISRSRPERMVMTPVAFALAVCAGLVAWS